MEWVRREPADEGDLPTQEGFYRIMVTGDSEYIDGHCMYEFPEYANWAYFTPHEDGGNFAGDYDEDNSAVFAWFGPIVIPEYKEL